MELDWNNAALRGQFAKASIGRSAAKLLRARLARAPSLSCKMQHLSLTMLFAKSKLAIRQRIISLADHPTRKGDKYRPVHNRFKETLRRPQLCVGGGTQLPPRRCACIKCGKMGHKFAECRTGWKATPIEDKGKAKETAKIGKESGTKSGKD
ncbi:hypothetical protein RHS01_05061 [Rhizoctonia solani]|uniref:CCHC-type domain-containing protein n=1 Tax=Rhizoctonia solani TaxID=456999 RepID=A0A8H7M5L6_9AGAM|nr:hypothetical protein RHS01_05061 [Rhizoctonia solani]